MEDYGASAYAFGPFVFKEVTYQIERVNASHSEVIRDGEIEPLAELLERHAEWSIQRFFEDNAWTGAIRVAGRFPKIDFEVRTLAHYEKVTVGVGAFQVPCSTFVLGPAMLDIHYTVDAFKDVRIDHREKLKNMMVYEGQRQIAMIQGFPNRFSGPVAVPLPFVPLPFKEEK